MAWDEDWLQGERADPTDLPDPNWLPTRRSRIVFWTYLVLFVGFFVVLELVGGLAVAPLGFPLVMILAAVATLVSIVVLYYLVHGPEREAARRGGEP